MTERPNSGDYGNPAPIIRDLDPYAYPPPDEPEDEGEPDCWITTKEPMKLEFGKQNTAVLFETYAVIGGAVIQKLPYHAGSQFFSLFCEDFGGPDLSWQNRKMLYQMGDGEDLWFSMPAEMLIMDPCELETVDVVTSIAWPDSFTFIGASSHIDEFKAGFFDRAVNKVKEKSRTKWR